MMESVTTFKLSFLCTGLINHMEASCISALSVFFSVVRIDFFFLYKTTLIYSKIKVSIG